MAETQVLEKLRQNWLPGWFHLAGVVWPSRPSASQCQAQMPFTSGMDPKPSAAPHMGGDGRVPDHGFVNGVPNVMVDYFRP